MATKTLTLWKVDKAHSEIGFRVKHLMVSTVKGRFTDFTAQVETEREDFEDARITFEADVASISTGAAQRDAHLRSDDFFNADAFPKMRFESQAFKKVKEDRYLLVGDLTIRDVTQSIELEVKYGGITKDHTGQTRAGFEVSGKLNRKDYGLKWNAMTETGGMVVSEEVQLDIHVQFMQD